MALVLFREEHKLWSFAIYKYKLSSLSQFFSLGLCWRISHLSKEFLLRMFNVEKKQ
jgi:hypothetical protein